MAGLSNTYESDALQYYFGGTLAVTRPTAWWISLHAGDPGESGSANAIAGGGAPRKQVTWATTTSGTSPTTKVSTSAQQWTGMPAVTSPGVTHIGIWSSELGTGAAYICTGVLTTPKVVTAGQTFDIAAGAITVTID